MVILDISEFFIFTQTFKRDSMAKVSWFLVLFGWGAIALGQESTGAASGTDTIGKEADKALVTTPEATAGDSRWECKNGALVREVSLTDSAEAGCEVNYHKKTEVGPDHKQTLYTSKSDKEYCNSKLQEFKTKLEGWGWTCASL
jgi:hypothetical protein